MSYQSIYVCPECRTVLCSVSYGQVWTVKEQNEIRKKQEKLHKRKVNCSHCNWNGTYQQAHAG